MAGTAVLTVDDLDHVNFVRTGLECEAQIAVANLAAKTDAMKPVWKHYRSHASVVRKLVYDNITVLSLGSIRQRIDHEDESANYRNKCDA